MNREEAVRKIAVGLWGRDIPTNAIQLAEMMIDEALGVGMVMSEDKKDTRAKNEPFYYIVNYTSKTLISKHEYYGKATKALEEYDNKNVDVIAIHNITHPKCPVWVKELNNG